MPASKKRTPVIQSLFSWNIAPFVHKNFFDGFFEKIGNGECQIQRGIVFACFDRTDRLARDLQGFGKRFLGSVPWLFVVLLRDFS